MLCAFFLENDFALHWSEAKVHEESYGDADIQEDDLEVDPWFEILVLLWHVRFVSVNEEGQVSDDAHPQEAVHLKQQTEGAFLTVQEAGIKLHQLVQGCECVVDEE